MIFYIFIKGKQFLFNLADNNATETDVISLDTEAEFQNVPYNQMNMTVFQSIRFTNKGLGPPGSHHDHGINNVYLKDKTQLEKMKKYISIKYKYVNVDWNVSPNGKFTHKYFPARDCKKEDFGTADMVDGWFKSWEGFSMICPDFENSGLKDNTWHFKGGISSFEINRGEFVIERCKNDPDKGIDYCESDENINKFVYDLAIDTWVLYEKINVELYGQKPIQKISDIVSS